jgi:hypothetical protein
MRKKLADAIKGWAQRWQRRSEEEKLTLIIQYLTVLTMLLGLFHFLH